MKGKLIAVILFAILVVGIIAEESVQDLGVNPGNDGQMDAPSQIQMIITDRLCLMPQACMDNCIIQGASYGVCRLQGPYVRCVCEGPALPTTTAKPKQCVVIGKCNPEEGLYCCPDRGCWYPTQNAKSGTCRVLME